MPYALTEDVSFLRLLSKIATAVNRPVDGSRTRFAALCVAVSRRLSDAEIGKIDKQDV